MSASEEMRRGEIGATMKTCPYHQRTARPGHARSGLHLPNRGETDGFCSCGVYTHCPVFFMGSSQDRWLFCDERFWLLGPAHTI
jgi:hypothetical protein